MKVSVLERTLKDNEERIKSSKPKLAHFYLYLNIRKSMIEFSSKDTYLIDPKTKTLKILKVIDHDCAYFYTIKIKTIKVVELVMQFED